VQFDSEALWSCVKNQVNAGDKVLIVRGGTASDQIDRSATMNGRPWLADQLSAMGVQVDMVVSYQRGAPVFDAAEKALMAQASGDGSIWLLSSSEAVANLKAIAGLNWTKATAVATHPRIAQAAREAGFGVVYESRPTLADVSASIESLL
jgi:uroporphyrinogen-III synthase